MCLLHCEGSRQQYTIIIDAFRQSNITVRRNAEQNNAAMLFGLFRLFWLFWFDLILEICVRAHMRKTDNTRICLIVEIKKLNQFCYAGVWSVSFLFFFSVKVLFCVFPRCPLVIPRRLAKPNCLWLLLSVLTHH